MKKFELLRLADKEYIKFTSYVSLYELYICDFVEILCLERQDLVLYYGPVMASLSIFIKRLRNGLSNRLQLDSSIIRDIGYMYNNYLRQPGNYKMKNGWWVGESFLIWSSATAQPKVLTWLYNDPDGNIVMHITENYPWHFRKKGESENYISYNKFIKNYKPILIRIIPHQVARQWLAQCEYLLATVRENEQR